MLIVSSNHRDGNPVKVFTSRMLKSKKLQEDKLKSKVKLGT